MQPACVAAEPVTTSAAMEDGACIYRGLSRTGNRAHMISSCTAYLEKATNLENPSLLVGMWRPMECADDLDWSLPFRGRGACVWRTAVSAQPLQPHPFCETAASMLFASVSCTPHLSCHGLQADPNASDPKVWAWPLQGEAGWSRRDAARFNAAAHSGCPVPTANLAGARQGAALPVWAHSETPGYETARGAVARGLRSDGAAAAPQPTGSCLRARTGGHARSFRRYSAEFASPGAQAIRPLRDFLRRRNRQRTTTGC
eukprot:362012-Chlamydomonas_euryale.AAC.4